MKKRGLTLSYHEMDGVIGVLCVYLDDLWRLHSGLIGQLHRALAAQINLWLQQKFIVEQTEYKLKISESAAIMLMIALDAFFSVGGSFQALDRDIQRVVEKLDKLLKG